jgi:hypothetical protein
MSSVRRALRYLSLVRVGETALRRHLPENQRGSFDLKKQERRPMAELMKQRSVPAVLTGKDVPEELPEVAEAPMPTPSAESAPAPPSSPPSTSHQECKLRYPRHYLWSCSCVSFWMRNVFPFAIIFKHVRKFIFQLFLNCLYEFCGSLSGIWCLFEPRNRDPKVVFSGSRISNPGCLIPEPGSQTHIVENLVTIFSR